MRFAAIKGVNLRVLVVGRNHYHEVRLKQPMTKDAQIRKHRSAKHDSVDERSAIHVLNDVRKAGANQHFANRLNQPGPLVSIAIPLGEIRIGLARRRCMNGVKRGDKLWIKLQRVRLNKWKRIIRLRLNIDADNLKARFSVTDAGTPGAAEKIEQAWLIYFHSLAIIRD